MRIRAFLPSSRCAALAASLTLAGCTFASEPMVDRMNVSDARYAQDLAACKQQSGIPLGFTNPVAKCLSGKGYTVLMGK